MSEKPAEELTYEQALELFDARLRALEEGNLTLEQAIEAVAEGRRYLKICEAKLEAARHKIEVRPEPLPGVSAAAEEDDRGVGRAQASPSTADRGDVPPQHRGVGRAQASPSTADRGDVPPQIDRLL